MSHTQASAASVEANERQVLSSEPEPRTGHASAQEPAAMGLDDPGTLRPMTLADVHGVAALHAAHLSDSFFARIGLGFLRCLYRRIVLSRHGIAFVYEPVSERAGPAQSRVEAFISAAYDSAALRREFLLKDGPIAAACLALAAARRPWIAARAVETLAYGAKTGLPEAKAEMLFISLEPSLRRRGLAIRLIDQVFDAFRARGVGRVKVTTEAANEPVNQLLARLGFHRQFEFRLHGKRMWLHARSVGSERFSVF